VLPAALVGTSALSSFASALREGERIEVRGFVNYSALQNPHPTLSLEKGEAKSAKPLL